VEEKINRKIKHKLKTMPCYFEDAFNGSKKFEIRFDKDRGFQKGDLVLLQEYGPFNRSLKNQYTGRELLVKITYVTGFEQKEGWVVFGFRVLEKESEV